MTQRVRWDCHTPVCGEKTHHGTVWIPAEENLDGHTLAEQRERHRGHDFVLAVTLGLCESDDFPFKCRDDLSDPVLVTWDDTPGRLFAHHRDDLEYT